MDSLLTFMELLLINMLLSGDNAVVIAMASQHLPPEQRRRAVWWGAGAAVALRIVLTLAAVSLLQIPYLQAAGSIMLYIIAVKLLLDSGEHSGGAIRRSASLGAAIRTIVAADFVMSLDNVLAVAAVAEGEPVLIVLGIALSIPLIIWGSSLIGAVMRKFPQLIFVGAALLGYTAGEMLVRDPGVQAAFIHGWPDAGEAVPLLSVPLVIVIYLLRRRA